MSINRDEDVATPTSMRCGLRGIASSAGNSPNGCTVLEDTGRTLTSVSAMRRGGCATRRHIFEVERRLPEYLCGTVFAA